MLCTSALHRTAPHCSPSPAAYGIDRSLQHTLHLLLRFSSDPFICAAIVDVFGALASRRSCIQATECSQPVIIRRRAQALLRLFYFMARRIAWLCG